MSAVRVQCPDCGRIVAGRVCPGGDGSAWHPVYHKSGLKPCGGRFATVWEESAKHVTSEAEGER